MFVWKPRKEWLETSTWIWKPLLWACLVVAFSHDFVTAYKFSRDPYHLKLKPSNLFSRILYIIMKDGDR